MAPQKKGLRKDTKSRGRISPALKKARIKIKSLENEKLELARELAEAEKGTADAIQRANWNEKELKQKLDQANLRIGELNNQLRSLVTHDLGINTRLEELEKENKELRETVDDFLEEIMEQQADTVMLIRTLRKNSEQ